MAAFSASHWARIVLARVCRSASSRCRSSSRSWLALSFSFLSAASSISSCMTRRVDLVEFGGHGVDLGADPGARLVHQVDGLVGQEAVRDVAVREHGRGDQGVVLDAHAVVHLEALLEAAQDGDRVLDARRVHHHRLEAALQGGVLLDVLAVLVQGRGADAVQLAARQHGLEHVAGVRRPLGAAGADDGVQLVDEEQDPPLALLDLVRAPP